MSETDLQKLAREFEEFKKKILPGIDADYTTIEPNTELKQIRSRLHAVEQELSISRTNSRVMENVAISEDTLFCSASKRLKIVTRVLSSGPWLDVRLYFPAQDGSFTPSRRGIFLPLSQWERVLGLVSKAVAAYSATSTQSNALSPSEKAA